MSLDGPWVWLAGVVAGWVFLGLVAGRFSAARNQLADPTRGAGRPGHADAPIDIQRPKS